MAIRTVLRMGDPRLLRPSDRVLQLDTPELHALLADMQETMASLNGAGLAAPQIGEPWRVVIFGTDAPNPRYPDAEIVSMSPTNGSTIYVTLYSYVGGQWLSNTYTYTSGP